MRVQQRFEVHTSAQCRHPGDWREELIERTADNKELRIYTTVIPTEHRIYTLMHDPQYRESIALQNVDYNQPPWTSFFLATT